MTIPGGIIFEAAFVVVLAEGADDFALDETEDVVFPAANFKFKTKST